MGKCLNDAAIKRGHRVTWIQSPKDARTALELQKKLEGLLPKNDALIMAAAVADVRPANFSRDKIKKDRLRNIRLVKNPDILAVLSKKKKKGHVFVGFALETKKPFENAVKKMKDKKLEAIVLQQVKENDAPFGNRLIDAIVLENEKNFTAFKSVSKQRLANFLVRKTEQFLLLKNRDS